MGIKRLCYIYFVNVALYLLSLALFENRILILGKEAGILLTWIIRFGLIFIPLYLGFRLRILKKDAWFLALFFHVYFIINNVSSFLESMGFGHTLVRIVGLYGLLVYSPAQLFVILLNTMLNIFILTYLFRKKIVFFSS